MAVAAAGDFASCRAPVSAGHLRIMHIGIVPSIHRGAGGVYQYNLNVLRALCRWQLEGERDEFTLFVSQKPQILFCSTAKGGRLSHNGQAITAIVKRNVGR